MIFKLLKNTNSKIKLLKNKKPMSEKKKRLLMLITVTTVMLCVFATAGIMTFLPTSVEEPPQPFIHIPVETPEPTPEPTPTPTEEPTTTPEPTPEPEPEMIPAMKAVWEQNNDFAGWLRIRDTIIDYPVMFRPDDWGFYVRRNFVGEDDNAGTLFIDENNTLDPRSTNLIIYGHDMRNGTMFGSLIKYTDKDFFLQHPIIEFTTLYERNEYEIVSVFKSRIFYRHERNVFRFYQFYNAETEEEFNEFVENMQKIQLFDTGITPEFGDKLIMLLTCERSQENGRLAVVARRVRDENAR